MGDADAPITPEEFAARWRALDPGPLVALAVSGGRDSMALARLAARNASAFGAEIIAFTVDHGLRAGSDVEAAKTVKWCASAGVPCEVLIWRGAKPASGVQAAARAARYRLLAQAAETAGAGALMTAHNADDQAETFFMRLARGAGPAGLAGMADVTAIAAEAGAPVRLLRPLLGFSRARLTATVRAFEQPYLDDPSNDDPMFERVRARALLAALQENELLTRDALLRSAERMAAASGAMRASENAAFRESNGCFYRWGGAALDVSLAARAEPAAGAGLARRLIRAVSGADYAPAADDAAAAVAGALETVSATLGGVLIRRKAGRLWFLREPAALCGRGHGAVMAAIDIQPGERLLWDRRFIIDCRRASAPVRVEPFGLAAQFPAQRFPQGAFAGPFEAMAGLPAVLRAGALIAAPGALSKASPEISFTALAEERFQGRILRFSGQNARDPGPETHGAALS